MFPTKSSETGSRKIYLREISHHLRGRINVAAYKVFLHVPSFVYSIFSLCSNGCLHVHPDAMKKIDEILQNDLNVTANKNPYGKMPYPYSCQGILSIQQIDGFAKF